MMARADKNIQTKAPGKSNCRSKRTNEVPRSVSKLCHYGPKESAWVERYTPQSLADHFVHKNKVMQLETWLNDAKGSAMCLLTGPAGSGKTATVHLIAKQLGYQVKEWTNPMSLTEHRAEAYMDFATEEVNWQSMSDSFANFLLRSSHYSSLPIKGKGGTGRMKYIILIEDFPNFFYTDVSLLHGLMRNYKMAGQCPLVFIMTDTTSSEQSSYKLFPKSLLLELDVHEIGLNPVAPSFMTKFLTNILAQARMQINDSVLLSDIVAASGGDMRSAVNNLQFRLQNPKIETERSSWLAPRSKRRKLTVATNRLLPVSKDESLFLFHGIGKVLYCKRDTSDVAEIESQYLQGKLESHRRFHPLKENPEQIGDRVGVAPETFFNFLAQNYLSFFKSFADVVTASGYLADASDIFSHWVPDENGSQTYNVKCGIREEFGLSVAVRGLMFANQNPAGSTWRPLKKPKFREVATFAETMLENTRAFCPGPVTQDYFTDLVPYMSLFCSNPMPPDKRAFLSEFGRFVSSRREAPNLLDEADSGGLDEVMTPESGPISDVPEEELEQITPEAQEISVAQQELNERAAAQEEAEDYEIEEVSE